jgi:hypothetical protein
MKGKPMSHPYLQNVRVAATRTPDGSGNAMNGQYEIICDPSELTITKKDTIINYYFISPTPQSIVFTGLEMSEPSPVPQFSIPTISVDGKMIMFSDLNTVAETNSVILLIADDNLQIKFDPQIQNIPED